MTQVSTQIEEILYEGLMGIEDSLTREEFLNQTCQGNPERRARLEELLSLQGEAEDFFGLVPELDSPASEARDEQVTPPNANFAEGLGTRIGRYRLIERLGEGGCGAVYLAEQSEPVRRKVALKIIRMGFGNEEVIKRFEAERQTLALMDHPNIARVLDAGTTDSGQPFFVMQLVDGLRITEFCDQNRLDLPARLRLFMLVCRAIQHAHQKGIIHCDIKPSNIMVTLHDGVAVPKVIDFGVAKATEGDHPDFFSVAAHPRAGTPAYMSPEQVDANGMDVDTRTDIYSLGLVLYELIVGKPPRDPEDFKTVTAGEIRNLLQSELILKPSERFASCSADEQREIATARGVKPSSLRRMLRCDLDAIVMKATAPDRRDRYNTASGLASDLSNYLNNDPVSAHVPCRGYRLGKLIRRNRLVFAAGAIVVFALSSGFGASTWLLFRENRARMEQERLRDVAEMARAQEAKLREKAEAGELVAHAAVLANRDEIPQAYDLLAQVSMENVPASLESANTFRKVADWLLREGRYEDAAKHFAAVAQAISLVDKSNAEFITLHFVAAAAALADAGDMEHYEELRNMAAGRFSNPSPVMADEVVKSCLLMPADPELLANLAPLVAIIEQNVPWGGKDSPKAVMATWQMLSMALVAYRQGDFGKAESWARRCLRHSSVMPPRDAAVRAVLAMALHQAGHPADARDELEKARAVVNEHFKEPFQIETSWTKEGYWFDWFIARILLREAESVLEG